MTTLYLQVEFSCCWDIVRKMRICLEHTQIWVFKIPLEPFSNICIIILIIRWDKCCHFIKWPFHSERFSLFQTSCVLSAINITDENTIISVKLKGAPESNPVEAFNKLKVDFSLSPVYSVQIVIGYVLFQNQCLSIVEQLSYDINSQSNELAAHQLLSVYKMAEVQIVSPEISQSRVIISLPLLLLVAISTIPFGLQLI